MAPAEDPVEAEPDALARDEPDLVELLLPPDFEAPPLDRELLLREDVDLDARELVPVLRVPAVFDPEEPVALRPPVDRPELLLLSEELDPELLLSLDHFPLITR